MDLKCPFHGIAFCFLSNKDFWESRESDPWLLEGEVDVYEVITIGISDDHRSGKSRVCW